MHNPLQQPRPLRHMNQVGHAHFCGAARLIHHDRMRFTNSVVE